jgi:multidrug efflux pump subunit AcrB
MALHVPKMPTAFVPDEDQGTLIIQVSDAGEHLGGAHPGAVDEVRDYVMKRRRASSSRLLRYHRFQLRRSRAEVRAWLFVGLKPWEERRGGEGSVFALTRVCRRTPTRYKDAHGHSPFPPPAILRNG